ncbi:protein FAR1-RELATED SEQUENCE 9-like [Arachis ipaensis]|uniref:protein FAR1-RELATED SEQUENCE 9-like n=1 Tax=Arachis ipaensis TaxID=130454 RepID=UPI000A2B7A55|nr:protein FAR1-RELATED SEQUENCE 9-like [Arachis ipaensis]
MCLKARSRRIWKMMLQARKESSHVYRALPSRDNFSKNTPGDSISVYHTFTVDFNPLNHEVWCECNMFESTGILCCHTLDVFSYYKVDRVPSCYVLPRWSKNVMRKHTYIRSSHDVARSATTCSGVCVQSSITLLRSSLLVMRKQPYCVQLFGMQNPS